MEAREGVPVYSYFNVSDNRSLCNTKNTIIGKLLWTKRNKTPGDVLL